MSGLLNHNPAEIIRQLLIDLLVGTMPEDNDAWPIYYSHHPDTPDDSICVYNSEGRINFSTQVDGETQEHYGIQVRVRAVAESDVEAKTRAIATELDQAFRDTVVLDSSSYLIQAISRVGSIANLGLELPTSRRRLKTINAVTAITME